MIRRVVMVLGCALFMLAVACSKPHAAPQLVVEIPSGFTGDFILEMGTRDAAPLPRDGDTYKVTLPHSGKLATSTVLDKPHITFKNASGGSVWGFSQSMFTTGDGISVGGKLEFFVGTQKDYEAEQNKKNHSGRSSAAGEAARSDA